MYVVIKGKKLIGAALCLIIVAAAVISWIGFSKSGRWGSGGCGIQR